MSRPSVEERGGGVPRRIGYASLGRKRLFEPSAWNARYWGVNGGYQHARRFMWLYGLGTRKS